MVVVVEDEVGVDDCVVLIVVLEVVVHPDVVDDVGVDMVVLFGVVVEVVPSQTTFCGQSHAVILELKKSPDGQGLTRAFP